MEIDTDRIFALIGELAHERLPVKDKMNRLIGACAETLVHPDWELFRELPYDEDETFLREWILDVISSEPPPFEIRGVWFGVANYGVDGGETSDMHFIGSQDYDPDDPDQEWAVFAGYRPEDGEANSLVLDRIYQIA